MKPKSSRNALTGARVHIVAGNGPAAFSVAPRERLLRQLARLDMTPEDDPTRAQILLCDACLYGNAVVSALAGAPAGTVLADAQGRIAGARVEPGRAAEAVQALVQALAEGAQAPRGARDAVALAGRYDAKLRKRTDPTLLRPSTSREAERALFAASYKGVTDLVTKNVWPAPALVVTRWCAALRISPNQVTYASAALVGVTFWLFWTGQFGVGLVVAWLMTFLDTVDGKLARVTLASSRFGDWLDHGIDLVHPPFWWWAWVAGCAAIGTPLEDGGLALGAIVGGYVLQRAEEGFFIARFGIELHIWRRFDSLFRQITARRNPNLVILMVATLAGAPRAGLIAVAGWTVLCLAVHLVRILQALIAVRRAPLTSWLAGG